MFNYLIQFVVSYVVVIFLKRDLNSVSGLLTIFICKTSNVVGSSITIHVYEMFS